MVLVCFQLTEVGVVREGEGYVFSWVSGGEGGGLAVLGWGCDVSRTLFKRSEIVRTNICG